MTLQFYLNGQTLTLSPKQLKAKVVADSKNYLKVSFQPQTSEWKNVDIWIMFSHNGRRYKKRLGEDKGLGRNECYVPPQVIKAKGFTVSAFCGDLITTNAVTIEVEPSGYGTETGDTPGDNPGSYITRDEIFKIIDEYFQNNQIIWDPNEE